MKPVNYIKSFVGYFISAFITTSLLLGIFFLATFWLESTSLDSQDKISQVNWLNHQKMSIVNNLQKLGGDLRILASTVDVTGSETGKQFQEIIKNKPNWAGLVFIRPDKTAVTYPLHPKNLPCCPLARKFGNKVMKFAPGQILISGWKELNLLDYPEPSTPELWLGIPVYRADKLKGAILLRYEAKVILELINRNTQMLYGRNGRRVGNGRIGIITPIRQESSSLARKFPGEWREMAHFASGQFRTYAGLFTFTTIHPDRILNPHSHGVKFPEPVWKLVSFYPRFSSSRKALVFQESRWLIPAVFGIILLLTFLYACLKVSRRRYEDMLKWRDQLTSVASKVSVNLLASSEIPETIAQSLEFTGKTLRVDSVVIYEDHKTEFFQENPVSQFYEWTPQSLTVEEIGPKLHSISYRELYPHWYEEFVAGRIVMGKIQEFPEEESAILEMLGYDSILLAPIMIHNSYWGFIGVYEKKGRHVWTDNGISNLQTIGSAIGSAIIRQRSLENLAKAKHKAEEATRSKSEFLSSMSHEIRTPLNAIIGFTDILSESVTNPTERNYLHSIQASSKSLLTLINDILDLSKVEAGKLDFEYTPINPRTVFREMKEIFSQKVKKKNIEFILDISPELPQAFILDETRIRQILLNLVGNAVKFTESGHVKLIASCTFPDSNRETANLMISVEDSGIGIPEDQLNSIFGAFSQQLGQDREKYGGTGLGLAITQRLVEAMNGKISVASTLGKGSVFTFELYNVKVIKKLDKTDDRKLGKPGKLQFEPATLLVIDDETSSRNLLGVYLKWLGFEVVEAMSAKMALEKIRDKRPDLIFTDIKMPEMDGCQFTEILKKSPQWKDIPVIAVTALVMKEEAENIRKTCDGFIAKPFDRNQLLAELKKHLEFTESDNEQESPEQIDSVAETDEGGTFDQEFLDKLPELLDKLEKEILPEWQKLEEALTIRKVVGFSEKVLDFSIAFHCAGLQTWAMNLQQMAEAFEMDKLDSELKNFPEIHKKLQSLVSK